MEWENKFSSIVRETEANLAKVKDRLGNARAYSIHSSSLGDSAPNLSMSKLHMSDQLPVGNSMMQSNSLQPWSSYRSGQNQSFMSSTGMLQPSHAKEMQPHSLETSPGVIALLQDKIDAQAKAIDDLRRTVQTLQEEKQLQHRHMKNLQEDVAALNNRVCEKGVDLQTERKLEQWRREVMGELQVLQHQLQMQRTRDDNLSVNYTSHDNSMSRELRDVKRDVQMDCDTLRRDMDSVRGRIVKAEGEIAGVRGDVYDMNYKHDRLNRDDDDNSGHSLSLQDLSTHNSYNKKENHRHKPQTRHEERADRDITQLKSSLRGLQDEVNQIMSSSIKQQKTKSDKITQKPPKWEARRERQLVSTPSPTTSDLADLDLSDSEDDCDLITDFSLSTKNVPSKSQDLDDLADTIDLDLTTEDLSSVGDGIYFDELH